MERNGRLVSGVSGPGLYGPGSDTSVEGSSDDIGDDGAVRTTGGDDTPGGGDHHRAEVREGEVGVRK